MIKYLSFLFLLLTTDLVLSQNLTATQQIPSSADPGSEFTVEVTINRGQINGFMKFFQELPAGFVATEIDSKGGSFTYAESGAKIVWISTPGEVVFTIKYKVKVPQNATGTKSFGGKVAFVENNERKSVDLESKTVSFGSAPVAAKTEAPVKSSPPVSSTTTTSDKPVASSQPAATSNNTPAKSSTSSQPASTTKTETSPAAKTTSTASTTPAATKTETASAPKSTASSSSTTTETKKEKAGAPKLNTYTAKSTTPVTAIPSSPGRTYRVQIGAFNLNPTINGVPEHTTMVLDNGMTKHFSGNFATYQEADKRKKEMISQGFSGAFIVQFENGKPVK